MIKKTSDALSRSDRVLFAALAIILATASAAVGSAMTYHPSTDKAPVIAAVQPAVAPVVQPMAQAPGQPTIVRTGVDTALTRLLAEHRCLSEVLYYEARGEGRTGQQAIAEVVFHRMNHGNYGHSICAVVYEGAYRHGCQFSFTCNGELTRAKQTEAWRQSEFLAAQILTGEVRLKDSTGGALNFHAASVSPDWSETMAKTTQIGKHVFYRGGAPHLGDS